MLGALRSEMRPISTYLLLSLLFTYFGFYLYFWISILWQETNQQSSHLLLVESILLVMVLVLLVHTQIVHVSRYELSSIHDWPMDMNFNLLICNCSCTHYTQPSLIILAIFCQSRVVFLFILCYNLYKGHSICGKNVHQKMCVVFHNWKCF